MRIFTNRQWREHQNAWTARVVQARNRRDEPTYKERKFETYERALRTIWERHRTPYPQGQPGDTAFGQTWWCSGCRRQWPCPDAKLVLEASADNGITYGPLRMPIEGETIADGSLTIGGTWLSVQGLKVPKVKANSNESAS